MKNEPNYGDVVQFRWVVSKAIGTVTEVYGEQHNRRVVIMVDPEMSDYVVAEPTTVSLPIDDVLRVIAAA